MTLFLPTPMVILNSCEAIYEAFVKKADQLSQRPPEPDYAPIFLLTGGMNNIKCYIVS